MVRVREVIVVEGRYDKNTLSQVVDATILETRGFGVRKDKALLSLPPPGGGEAGADSAHGFRWRGLCDPKLLERSHSGGAAEAGLHPRHVRKGAPEGGAWKRGKAGGGGHEARGASGGPTPGRSHL